MTGREVRSEGSVALQALQFAYIGQAPVTGPAFVGEAAGSIVQLGGRLQCVREAGKTQAVGKLQPDQSSEIVGYGAVAVVGESRDGPRHTSLKLTILTGTGTGNRLAKQVPASVLTGFGKLRIALDWPRMEAVDFYVEHSRS